MAYQVIVTAPARKQLLALPKQVRERAEKRIDALADDPRPPKCKALHGEWKGHYRIRVGEYRVVYRVEDDVLIVLVIRVGPRGDIYE